MPLFLSSHSPFSYFVLFVVVCSIHILIILLAHLYFYFFYHIVIGLRKFAIEDVCMIGFVVIPNFIKVLLFIARVPISFLIEMGELN